MASMPFWLYLCTCVREQFLFVSIIPFRKSQWRPQGAQALPDPNENAPVGGVFIWVGPPGIEPGPYEPESHVLPVYYGPNEGKVTDILMSVTFARVRDRLGASNRDRPG